MFLAMAKHYSIAKNSLYNVVGWLLPAIVQLVSVPYIVKNLGYDSYGIWTLVMAVMGYFAFLDMNMLKGGIRYLAEYDGKKDTKRANQVANFGLLAYLAIGLIGMLVIAACVDTLLLNMLKIPIELKEMARATLYMASLGFLFLMMQNYLLSIPKALHRFDISNKIEMTFTVGSILLTVCLLYMGYGLLEVVIGRLLANFACILIAYRSINKVMPYYKFTPTIDKEIIKKVSSYSLVSFAGRIGMTTTSYANTFVAGSLIGTSAITIFTVPFMLVERIMNISSRLSMVIFPIASELGSQSKHDELIVIYRKMTKYIFNINIFLTLMICLFSLEIMTLWMGQEFAEKSTLILILVSIGFLFNTTTGLPSLVNDGIGHPKVTSIFAFIHGAVSVTLLIIFGQLYGLNGIAFGYCMASILMAIVFNIYVHVRVIDVSWIEIIRTSYLGGILFSVFIVVLFLIIKLANASPEVTIIGLIIEAAILSLSYFTFAYLFILDKRDRSKVVGIINRVINRNRTS